MTFLDIPIKIKNNLEQRMFDIFSLYDFIGNSMVDNKCIPKILRFLGCAPTEAELMEFIKECEFLDIQGSVHVMQFMKVLNDWLLLDKMKPSPLEILEGAFKILDPDDKGFITYNEYIEFLKKGEHIENDELNVLIGISVDRLHKACYYESYIYKLLHEPNDCIYKEAQIEAEKLKIENEKKKEN